MIHWVILGRNIYWVHGWGYGVLPVHQYVTPIISSYILKQESWDLAFRLHIWMQQNVLRELLKLCWGQSYKVLGAAHRKMARSKSHCLCVWYKKWHPLKLIFIRVCFKKKNWFKHPGSRFWDPWGYLFKTIAKARDRGLLQTK